MHQLAEFLPVILFFLAYKLKGIFVATGVLMGASLLQFAYLRIRGKKPTRMQVISLLLILGFGAVTLLFRDEQYIKWKVTLVNWLFGVVFLGSHFIGKETILEKMLSEHVKNVAPQSLRRLSLGWVGFFFFLGALNIYVFTNFSTEVWVDFKLFGLMGLTFLFVLGQAVFLQKAMSKAPSN